MQRSARSGHPAAQGTRQWKQLRTKFKAHCRALNALCWICVGRGDIEHAQINYDAEPLRPLAFEADHFKPWSTHPYLAYEWANLRASHVRCNRARRDEEVTLVDVQREWVKPDW